MQTLKAAVLYFAAGFAAGFAMGAIRVPLIAPWLGERAAELAEAPVMLVLCYFAARWTVRKCRVPEAVLHRLGMGLVALALMLVSEFELVLRLRGLTVAQYFATRDPVSGAVYYASLVLFALFPLLVRSRRSEVS